MTSIADLASIVTSGATCVALVFAGVQLQQTRASDRRRCRVEIEGVAVSWRLSPALRFDVIPGFCDLLFSMRTGWCAA